MCPQTHILGTRTDDDGSEKRRLKKNEFAFFQNRVYLDPLKMSNAGDFPGVEFLRILFSFKNRKENSSSYCSRNRTVDVKEMN